MPTYCKFEGREIRHAVETTGTKMQIPTMSDKEWHLDSLAEDSIPLLIEITDEA